MRLSEPNRSVRCGFISWLLCFAKFHRCISTADCSEGVICQAATAAAASASHGSIGMVTAMMPPKTILSGHPSVLFQLERCYDAATPLCGSLDELYFLWTFSCSSFLRKLLVTTKAHFSSPRVEICKFPWWRCHCSEENILGPIDEQQQEVERAVQDNKRL
jgi:hypothetical protein